jgi:riboflavin kinase/FMN adenylyltransferase
LAVGFDSRLGNDMLQGSAAFSELANRLGLVVQFADALGGAGSPIKSSRIRGLVEAGDMRGAGRLLGHPYFVLSPVVHGKGKGTERLALPTANLILPPEKLVPPVGVYAALAEVAGQFFPAATCVMSPELWQATPLEIGSSGVPSGIAADQSIVETHLIGFTGDLYGNMLTLHFLERLRGWQAFTAVSALQTQIAADIELTRSICQQHGLAVQYGDAPA